MVALFTVELDAVVQKRGQRPYRTSAAVAPRRPSATKCDQTRPNDAGRARTRHKSQLSLPTMKSWEVSPTRMSGEALCSSTPELTRKSWEASLTPDWRGGGHELGMLFSPANQEVLRGPAHPNVRGGFQSSPGSWEGCGRVLRFNAFPTRFSANQEVLGGFANVDPGK